MPLYIYFPFMVAAMSILSLPPSPATLLAAKLAPAWQVALVGAAAAAIAAPFDHWFVRHVSRVPHLDRLRKRRFFRLAESWAIIAPFWTTAAFAAVPVPFAVVRILMPVTGYPVPR